MALAVAVTELLNHTRRARTALWCAVQTTSAEYAAALSCLTDNDPAACWCSPPLPTAEPLDAVSVKKC